MLATSESRIHFLYANEITRELPSPSSLPINKAHNPMATPYRVLFSDGWAPSPGCPEISNYSFARRPISRLFVCSTKMESVACIADELKSEESDDVHESWMNFFADRPQWWDSKLDKEDCVFVRSSSIEALSPSPSPKVEEELAAWRLSETQADHVVRMDDVQNFGENLDILCFGRPSELCNEGQLNNVLHAVDIMDQKGLHVSTNTYSRILHRCIEEENLKAGREIHYYIVRSGMESDAFLGTCLIRMFTTFDMLLEAIQVFNKLSLPSVFSWSAIISAHTKLGQNEQAIQLYQQMNKSDVKPDGHVFVAVLKACSSIGALEQGKWIHTDIIQSGFESDQFVGSILIDMYCKHGSLNEAWMVFDRLPKRDMVIWSALISGNVQHGHAQEALHIFQEMQEEGMKPDKIAFVSVLQACSSIAALEQGKHVHKCIVEVGLESNRFIGSTLINMYANCGDLEEARNVFDRMPQRDLATWSAMIAGYAQNMDGQEALQNCREILQLFERMQQGGVKPDKVTYVCILQACSSIAALKEGKHFHSHIIESGYEWDLIVGNTLVDMYAKCGSIKIAQIVFDRLPVQDLVTWTALLAGCAQHGYGLEALKLYNQMQRKGMEPNEVTLICTLQACSTIAALQQGKQIHKYIIENGLESFPLLANTLIDMYAKCGSLDDACALFNRLPVRDGVTWSALMAGYALRGDHMSAIQCFADMQQAGIRPNLVTYLSLLSAYSHVGVVNEGCLQFKLMREDHGIVPALEHYTVMIDLFGRAGCLIEAEDLLESLPFRSNDVGWTSLLGSCRTHENVEIGRRSFNHLVRMEGVSAAAYVLMSKIFVHAGMKEEAEKVEDLRRCANLWKKPAKAFIEVDNQVHDFIVGDDTHPYSDDIYAELKALSTRMKMKGYVPCLDMILGSKSDEEKEDTLCGHSEKLAITFGLICTPQGMTIRVAKNLRVCTDCHNFVKMISKTEMREIIITDAYRIHHFKDGSCCCNDYY